MIDKNHKLILDHVSGPAVYYRCLCCRGVGFYLTNLAKLYDMRGLRSKINFVEEVLESNDLNLKIETTWDYINSTFGFKKSVFTAYGYFSKKDFDNLNTLVKCSCKEVIIKEVIE